MLDTTTKRRIDTARDILVGKIPDPKSQVEQITIALIYKFMDDMDAESEELGGTRNFFAGDFARYGWAKLMRSGLGGHEILNLYAEAIARMPENPGIPLLFRNIFKNAYLPYRDPETLRAFLKVIDEFNYDHSERLGDAFEYLLSVLGSQGDAGQFRTPRHIIDFIVEIVDPKKNETVLDPACGTAGFLISSYKHILKNNLDQNGYTTLTPDDKGRMVENFSGYDISPDMIRLSLVNMYLHGFSDPHIYEYDTLTSQDRWNEYADVILANPPFMSPKGGIRPHNRFSVQSKRSEVLFVDYIADHLTPEGRAGVIVPEGIIFQSQNAYKQLRKKLLEESLVAVISLPAGVFQPYSGVKTSILILDKALAKKADTIAFFKVENDGYGLGAQRRPIDKNDLPGVLEEVKGYFDYLRVGDGSEEYLTQKGLVVKREKVAENGEYNLSGERYREVILQATQYKFVNLGEVCKLVRGVTYNKSDEVSEDGYKILRANNIDRLKGSLELNDIKLVRKKLNISDDKKLRKDDIFICLASGSKDHIGKVAYISTDTEFYFGGFMGALRTTQDRLLPKYLFYHLRQSNFNQFLREQIAGANINNLGAKLLYEFKIPLPPLEIQKEIINEIEIYQKVIDGARAVVENYRPHIPIDPAWPMVEIKDACSINPESVDPAAKFPDKTIFYADITSVENRTGRFIGFNRITAAEAPSRARRVIKDNDILLSTVRPNLKAFALIKNVPENAIASTGFAVLRAYPNKAHPAYVYYSIYSDSAVEQMISMMEKGAYPSINQSDVSIIKIPLPPLSIQQDIVAEIEADQVIVDANRELIVRFGKKIDTIITRIWGEI